MTARTQKRRASLLKARFRRFSAQADDYGRHPLDSTKLELHPATRREVPADDPWLSPWKSAIYIECLLRIEAALAHTSVSELPEVDFDLRGFCEDAKLTGRQTEVVVMAGEGWDQRSIADWLGIKQSTVWQHLHQGRHKLAGWLPLNVAIRLAYTYQEAYIGAEETRLASGP